MDAAALISLIVLVSSSVLGFAAWIFKLHIQNIERLTTVEKKVDSQSAKIDELWTWWRQYGGRRRSDLEDD